MNAMPDGGDHLRDRNEAPEAVITASMWLGVFAAVALITLGVIVAFIKPVVGVAVSFAGAVFAAGMFLAIRGRRRTSER
ncbi:hypothetical protein [Streptomyces chilikensis]|uniref:hypothetical protein n=1 Tax=Streptomyces chilikensis TaxID=1194079 RepID=UPI000AF91BCE|nr:hypothetical protein [Streptomyces chilikensis]